MAIRSPHGKRSGIANWSAMSLQEKMLVSVLSFLLVIAGATFVMDFSVGASYWLSLRFVSSATVILTIQSGDNNVLVRTKISIQIVLKH